MPRVVRLLTGLVLALCGAGGVLAQQVAVSVEGGPETLPGALRGASLTVTLGDDPDAAPQDFVAATRADYRRLLTALYAAGHYGGTISIRIDGREAAGIAPLDAPDRIGRIDIVVAPGPLFTFGRAEIGPLAPGTELPEGFAPGQPARSGVIGDAARASITGWREIGHAKADIAGQQVTARHAQSRLDARIVVDPGPELRFGNLTITGNEAVRTERIAEIAGLPRGQVFSPAEVEEAEARLRRTGAFRSATLIEGDVTANGRLNMTAQIDEQAPRRLGFGAELNSVEGLGLSAFWLHRNLFGGAERFRIESEVAGIGGTTGGVDYGVELSYNRPATFRPDIDLYANVRIERIDDPNLFLDQASAEIGLTRIVNEELSYEAGIGILTAEVDDALGERSYTYLTFPIAGEWDRRDDELNPKGGFYLQAEITPFFGGEDAFGGRLYGDGRVYRSLGEAERLTLALRGQAGAVFGAEAEDAPADFLFFSGGGGTVRGQSFQSLGIDVGGGEQIGGRSFFGLQAEARFEATDRIGVVGFFDTGFVGTEPFSAENGEWHSGAGVGVRYQTAIGPIRLDLAVPVDGPDPEEDWQIYIGIGQAF